LIEQFIEEHPSETGEPRLQPSAVPVWAIIGHWQATGRDAADVARAYDIPEIQVRAALAYYKRHRAEIDARIAANAA
jgi:uncharacterized protein (DUF433 family)